MNEGILVTTHNGSQVLIDDPYVTLSTHCQAAGLTARQTQVVIEVARGRSNSEIAELLRIKVRGVEDTLAAGVRKLQDAYERPLPEHSSVDVLRCLRNRRSCNPRGGGGPAAQAFGTQPGDARRVTGGTGFLLELACRIQGAPVPMLGRRVGELREQAHKATCRCPRCHRTREKAYAFLALGRNRQERRAALFARKSGLVPRRSTGIA